MSDLPVQVIVAALQDEKAAVLRKGKKGKLHIKRPTMWGAGIILSIHRIKQLTTSDKYSF